MELIFEAVDAVGCIVPSKQIVETCRFNCRHSGRRPLIVEFKLLLDDIHPAGIEYIDDAALEDLVNGQRVVPTIVEYFDNIGIKEYLSQ